MFGRNNNQSNNGINVNTTFKILYSDISSLTIGGWNGSISLRIAMSTGTDGNGIRQYDNNRRGVTSLSPEKAGMLASGYAEKVWPFVKDYLDGKPVTGLHSVAVSLGFGDKRNALAIEFKPDVDGKMKHFLTLYQMVDQNNIASAQNTFSYKFNENTYVVDYDYNTGHYAEEKYCENEFALFLEILKNSYNILPIVAHGVKYVEAVGSRFNSGNNGNSQYHANSNRSTGNYDTPVSTFVGSDDLGLPFN